MSNEQEPKNVENEQMPEEELDNQELDQVVGGTLPAPTLPPTESVSLNFVKIEVEYKPQ